MEIVTLPEQVVIGIACEALERAAVVPEAWRRLFEQVGGSTEGAALKRPPLAYCCRVSR